MLSEYGYFCGMRFGGGNKALGRNLPQYYIVYHESNII
jgi:hypothetical protein